MDRRALYERFVEVQQDVLAKLSLMQEASKDAPALGEEPSPEFLKLRERVSSEFIESTNRMLLILSGDDVPADGDKDAFARLMDEGTLDTLDVDAMLPYDPAVIAPMVVRNMLQKHGAPIKSYQCSAWPRFMSKFKVMLVDRQEPSA